MTARTGWGRARSHPGHGGARSRMEEPDPGGNRPRRPWESSSLEPAGLGGASFHDRSRQIGRSSVPARPWGSLKGPNEQASDGRRKKGASDGRRKKGSPAMEERSLDGENSAVHVGKESRSWGRKVAVVSNSVQYGGWGLCIVCDRTQVQPIPLGIEDDFQFQYLSHPNNGIWCYPIPMPIPKPQCLHPNAT